MAFMTRGSCEDAFPVSTCENPQFPSWTWRYNRNKYLSRFEPMEVREERKHPQNRNMGMPRYFRFHPIGPDEEPRPLQAMGVNYAHNLNRERAAGFGNAALGKTPGPAPPRIVVYDVQGPYPTGDLYRINEINGLSSGVSLLTSSPLAPQESDETCQPLNPSHYLEKTLGQPVAYPGSFPHFNKPLPATSRCTPRVCPVKEDPPRDPMKVWQDRYRQQLLRHAHDRQTGLPCCSSEIYTTGAMPGLSNGQHSVQWTAR